MKTKILVCRREYVGCAKTIFNKDYQAKVQKENGILVCLAWFVFLLALFFS